MVENTRPVQPRDPFDRFDEAISDPRLYEADQSDTSSCGRRAIYATARRAQPQYEQAQYEQRYEQRTAAVSFERTDVLPEEMPPHEAVPLFLSDYEDEHYQELANTLCGNSGSAAATAEVAHVAHRGRRRCGVGGRRVLALFSIDSTRNVIFNAKARCGGAAHRRLPLSLPRRFRSRRSRSAACRTAARRRAGRRRDRSRSAARRPMRRHRRSPSRDEIAAAYQSARKVPRPEAIAARSTATGARSSHGRRSRPTPAVREPARRRVPPRRCGASIRTNSRRC